MSRPWRLWIDSGGTFTDCLALDPEDRGRRVKVLSSGRIRARLAQSTGPSEKARVVDRFGVPDDFFAGFRVRGPGDTTRDTEVLSSNDGDRILWLSKPVDLGGQSEIELCSPEPAPVLAIRLATGTPPGADFPPLDVRLATTRGTNALLESKGCPVGLFITRGFADLLTIGTQQRPDLFTLDIVKPPSLYTEVVEVDERLAADGSVLVPVRPAAIESGARRLLARGVKAAAVCLLHSYRNPAHERAVGAVLEGLGFRHVALSSDLSQRIKILPRAQTAVVDAYLSGVVSEYLTDITGRLANAPMLVMTSAGSLIPAIRFRPKDSLLSGPAGGVLGAAHAAKESGWDRFLAFDMGGTSTDVARFNRELEYTDQTIVGTARLGSAAVAIQTVAAGGGSVCRYDAASGRLRVGPESAGADPGPACYGAGGPLTLTDVNLLLGRLDPLRFPFRISAAPARALAHDCLARASGGAETETLEGLLYGFLCIANETMAAAIRRASVRRGDRTSDYGLVAFGGAGGQHACAIADLLNITRVLVPADAALLSARGLGTARVERMAELQVLKPLSEVGAQLPELFEQLADGARRLLAEDGVSTGQGQTEVLRARAYLRLQGQESTLEVDWLASSDLEAPFRANYHRVFGYEPETLPIEVESLRVVVAGPPADDRMTDPPPQPADAGPADISSTARLYTGSRWVEAACHERIGLSEGREVAGPALIFEDHSCTVVEPGWQAHADAAGALVLHRIGETA